MMEVLGPALVAGALGRKVGSAHTTAMCQGMTKCWVELASTRQKAKRPKRLSKVWREFGGRGRAIKNK